MSGERKMDITKTIGLNTYILKNVQIKKAIKESTGEIKEETKTENTQITNKQVSADDVLSFMANQSICMKPEFTNSLNVAKFADEEQYLRIWNMMKEFEASVEMGLKTFNGEFPNAKISEKSKLYTVLNSLERTDL